MVDELRLLTYPVALGAGPNLFGDAELPRRYRSTLVSVFPSGILGRVLMAES
jgi:hypothetical protein